MIDKAKISRIDCKAIAGIGYVFRMKIFFRNPKIKNATDDRRWHESNETSNISLGFTGKYDLRSIEGIENGAEVQLGLNVLAGPDREGNEKFIYDKGASNIAYYEAAGPCTDAALRYKDILMGIMEKRSLIIGKWTSRELTGEMFQTYNFKEDGTYEMMWASDTEPAKGLYSLIGGTLSFRFSPDRVQSIGYVGVDAKNFIEGFRRVTPGEGVEGEWELRSGNLFAKTFAPIEISNYYKFSLSDGVMKGINEVFINGKSQGVDSFSGKYSINGDKLVITDSNAAIAYLDDGEKQISIIDGVLLLVNEITCHSFFERV